MRSIRQNIVSPGRLGGMTLIELMVALAIGSFLIIGALTVFSQSRTTFRINESVSRLQENARFVFDVLEPEIRMANFWGLRTRAYVIDGRARDDAPLSGVVAGDCDTDWAIDLDAAVAANNDGYDWPGCDPGPAGADAVANADTLVVRRASVNVTDPPAPNTLYLQTTLGDAATLFLDDAIPAGFNADQSETHELIVNGFYVSENSALGTAGNPVPSLRRKRLRNGNAGDPGIVDEEILPGVEDMQVQLGVDTDPVGGSERGIVDRYVNPDDPILDPGDAAFNTDAEILSVRVWLRLRGDRPENGLPADNGYTYADQVVDPINDGFRRIVASKTIYLRNARPPE
ncbi:MAG TPA: PilW family protein [Gammaproteobacteria bacterium]|nr:PilW family protein [Gammaproteobacteria bacterium]